MTTRTLDPAPAPKMLKASAKPARLAPLAFLCFLAGMAALALEAAWFRMFETVLGGSAYATTAIIAAFIAALGAGAFLGGRVADRNVAAFRWFGIVEGAAGLLALVSFPLIPALPAIAGGFYRATGGTGPGFAAACFLVTLVVTGLPAALMGAAFPFLARHAVPESERASRDVAILYGANLVGGAIGIVFSGFYLLERMGARGTAMAASLLLIAVGIAAITSATFARSAGARGSAPIASAAGERDRARAIVLAAVALSGLSAFATGILWGRVLVYTVDSTIYTFVIMLAVYLAGLAAGSLALGPLAARMGRPLFALGLIEGFTGLALLGSVATLAAWGHLGATLAGLTSHANLVSWNLERALDCAVVVILPAIFLGATFPVAVRALGRRTGSDVGILLAVHSGGAVLGALTAGIVFAPRLGTDRSLLLAGFLTVLAGLALMNASRDVARPIRIAASVAIVLGFLVGRGLLPENAFHPLFGWRDKGAELLGVREGPQVIVTLHQYPGVRTISMNGVTTAGSDLVLSTTKRLQGHLPALLHGAPESALVIGVGGGETARVLLLEGLKQMDAVDTASGYDSLAAALSDENAAALNDPRCHRIVADGASFVRYTKNRYDIIVNDPTHPALTGGSEFFTRDYFRGCREHLNEDGIMASWVPLFGLRPGQFGMILRTFLDVFPHATLWYAGNCMNRHALLVATAADRPLAIDWSSLVRRMSQPEIAADLAELNLGDTPALLDCFVTDEKGIRTLAGSGPLHTAERPALEFDAPRVTGRDAEIVANLVESVSRARTSVFPLLGNFARAGGDSVLIQYVLARYFAGTTQVLRGIALDIRGVSSEPERAYRAALTLNPDDLDAKFFLQDKAVQEATLTQAIAANPEDRGARLELARIQMKQGKFKEALAGLLASSPEAERDASVWYDIGLCQARLDRAADAEKSYREAIRLNPTLPEPHVNLGALLQRAARYEDAVAEYKAALTLDPQHAEANYNLGVAYAQKGLHKDAIPCFERAVARRPTYHEAFYNLGVSRATTGDLPGAIEAWQTCLALNPANKAAEMNLARARGIMGKPSAPGAPGAVPRDTSHAKDR